MAKLIAALTELDKEMEGIVSIRSINYALKLIVPELKNCNLIPIFEKFGSGYENINYTNFEDFIWNGL